MLERWFSDAVGGLGWSPAVFWAASIAEFMLAVDGHNRMNRPRGPTPMTREEFEELDALYPPKQQG